MRQCMQIVFMCHECGDSFTAGVDNEWGTYEFIRCPACGSAKTTRAVTVTED